VLPPSSFPFRLLLTSLRRSLQPRQTLHYPARPVPTVPAPFTKVSHGPRRNPRY
jgi:hypothetical protein